MHEHAMTDDRCKNKCDERFHHNAMINAMTDVMMNAMIDAKTDFIRHAMISAGCYDRCHKCMMNDRCDD